MKTLLSFSGPPVYITCLVKTEKSLMVRVKECTLALFLLLCCSIHSGPSSTTQTTLCPLPCWNTLWPCADSSPPLLHMGLPIKRATWLISCTMCAFVGHQNQNYTMDAWTTRCWAAAPVWFLRSSHHS